jgi:hypothetical protein
LASKLPALVLFFTCIFCSNSGEALSPSSLYVGVKTILVHSTVDGDAAATRFATADQLSELAKKILDNGLSNRPIIAIEIASVNDPRRDRFSTLSIEITTTVRQVHYRELGASRAIAAISVALSKPRDHAEIPPEPVILEADRSTVEARISEALDRQFGERVIGPIIRFNP